MGLNSLQLEFEIQKILYKGSNKLIIYALQIAREFNIAIRKEIIESLLKSPTVEQTQAILQYLVEQESSLIFDYCLKIIENLPGIRKDLAIRTLLLPNLVEPNNSQVKKILTLVSRNDNDLQTAALIRTLQNISEQIPVKWFAAILQHRNPTVRLESTRLMATTAREELRDLLRKAWQREDQAKAWAGVGLWKLGDPRLLAFVEANRQSIKLLAYCGKDPQIIKILQSELSTSNCFDAAWALHKLENTESVVDILDKSLENAGTVLGLSLFNIAESMDSENCMNTLQRAIELEEMNTKKSTTLNKLTQLAISTPIARQLEKKLAQQKIPDNKKQALELNNLNQHERWLAPLIWKKWSESRNYLKSYIPC